MNSAGPPHSSRHRSAQLPQRAFLDLSYTPSREFRGRGPTKTRALYRDNILVVVLQDVMTAFERSLATHEWAREGVASRRQLHSHMCPALTAAVEGLTGSNMLAVMAGSHNIRTCQWRSSSSTSPSTLGAPLGPGGSRRN
jgi:uncharacterized protein YbcI